MTHTTRKAQLASVIQIKKLIHLRFALILPSQRQDDTSPFLHGGLMGGSRTLECEGRLETISYHLQLAAGIRSSLLLSSWRA